MELVAVNPDLSFMHGLNAFAKDADGFSPANHALSSCTEGVYHQIARRRLKEHDDTYVREGCLQLVQCLKPRKGSTVQTLAQQSDIDWTWLHAFHNLGTTDGTRNDLKPKAETAECVLHQLTTHMGLICNQNTNARGASRRPRFTDSGGLERHTHLKFPSEGQLGKHS